MLTPTSEEVFIFPVSFAQERLWFLDQLDPGNASYNIFSALQLDGQLNITALTRAIQEIQQRHEVLRTTFKVIDGVPFQVIASTAALTLPIIELDKMAPEEQFARIQRQISEEARKPFDLSTDSLVRVSLLKLAKHSHVLQITVHHIIADVWSVGIFIQELSALYKAFCQGEPSPLPDLPIQYADFAEWQRQWLSGEVLESQLDYWKQQLAGAPALLELPTDRPRPPVQAFRGSSETFELSAELTQQLKHLSQHSGATLFMTLQAAFALLLSRYSQQENIVVGSPIANRNRQEIEPLIGFFVNTLVLRTHLGGNPTFRELLQQVRQMTLNAYAHQDLPFEQLVEVLQPERSLSHHPLFQVMFVLQNAVIGTLELPGLTLKPLEQKRIIAKFDLTLSMQEIESGLVGSWEYNTDLFEADTIRRMMGHFQTLLEGIVSNPEQPVGQLPLLTEAERHQLLVEWNQTAANYPQDKCIHQLFEEQVERTPNAVAVVFEDSVLTYRELNTRANQLAHYLQKLSVEPEILVGLCVERSLEMVIGLLGILKAGGAYVPIDPTYPGKRKVFILEDTQMPLLLTQQRLAQDIPTDQTKVIYLDTDWQTIAQERIENPVSQTTALNLAYVIYTSGSTGKPKGTLIPHRGLVNYLNWCVQAYTVEQGSGTLVHSSLAFDLTITSLFSPLLVGCSVELLPENQGIDALCNTLRQKSNLSLIKITPAHLELFAQQLSPYEAAGRTRALVIGGENLTANNIAFWQNFAPNTILFNEYGPTETVVGCCIYQVPTGQHHSGSIPIGQPIVNTQLYVLDQHGQPVPIGVAGELHIGGVGLARGYLNQPDLSTAKFIPNPFNDEPGQRLYKTGDLARYRSDSTLEYLGRIDDQVKIRGFRIELGEIETVLGEYPKVREAVIIAHEDVLGNKHLVAYLVADEHSAPSNSEIRCFLKEKLPEYMVPSAFVVLDALPLSPNGKVNRQALSAPKGELAQDEGLVAPRTPTEEIIANIFASVLGLQQVGVHNNFFELGGHSLLATQVVSRLRQIFQVEIPLRTLFEALTVAELDQAISAMLLTTRSLVVPPMEPRPRDTEALPLSWAQERLWFLNQLEGSSPTYNVPAAVQITGQLNVVALEQALSELVQRHEVLRTTFGTVNGTPVQAIALPRAITIPLIDLQALPSVEQTTQVKHLVMQEAQRPFDLATGPLLRVTILQLGENSHLLLVTMHHIICDAWSIGVFIQELSTLYQTFVSGASCTLPELPIQYADFAQWQRQCLSGEVLESELNYWKQHLAGAPALLELPTDRHRPPVQGFRGSTETFELSAELTKQLKHLSQQSGATLFMTLQTAFVILLSRLSGQDDILIGTPIANRNRQEIESLIGFFVNTLVLRTQIQGNPSFSKLLSQVRQVALDAYAHQDVPFEQVVEALQPERNLSHSPLFQVMFVWQNTPMRKLELPGLTLTSLSMSSVTAKFDLTLSMQEIESGLVGSWEYNTDLFEPDTIRRMMGHFQTLLEGIVSNPEQLIGQLPLLTEAQRHQLLVQWNQTQANYPQDKCIHQLFEEQVERTPNAVAVVFEDQQLSYRELNCRANQLAHHLQALGVEPEVLVGLCVERSLEMVVGLLSILKAGGAYVPLDPAYPQERLSHILNDSQVSVLLTTEKLVTRLPEHQTQVVCLDPNWRIISHHSQDNPASKVKPKNLAYVIYTSGSTGKPKGVMIQHQSLVNFTKTAQAEYELSASDRVLQFASISFDTAAEEIYPCLTCGGMLVLRSNEMLSVVPEFLEKCKELNLTVLDLPTAYWHQVIFESASANLMLPESLRLVIIGGERALPEAVEMWQKYVGTMPKLVNTYGPTEATVVATLCKLSGSTSANFDQQEVSIGYPICNVQVYLLDKYFQPVPIGVPGELYIGGAGLARGYLNLPELTQEKFIPNPINCEKDARLYKTGDLARYFPDGSIQFLGRIDHQVKIRGFRIELEEIESVLTQCPQVRETVVIAWEDHPGNKRLVAYVVPQQERPTTSILRGFLKKKLPEYMVPGAFVFLEALPLTPNGKLDRRALPAPNAEIALDDSLIAPRTPTEEIIANIFASVLKLEQVGIQNNFFELGGHSLLATQVVSRLRESLQIEVPLRTLFESPTVAELDQAIWALRQTTSDSVVAAIKPIPKDTQALPLSWGQERLWFLDQLEGGNASYNMPTALQISGGLNIVALEYAFSEIIQRHSILRTTFPTLNGTPVQKITSPTAVRIPVVDLRFLSADEQTACVQQLATQQAQQTFDLAGGPLIRFQLLQLKEQSHVLLVTLHHIIFDAWSSDIFVRELVALYQAYIHQQPSPLSVPSIQYADFAYWQRQWLQAQVLEKQLSYWKQQLGGTLPILQLPTDKYDLPTGNHTTDNHKGEQQRIVLSKELTACLKTLSRQKGVTVFMTLLAAFKVLLSRHTGQEDLIVGVPIAGRNYLGCENLIGFFINTLPLRTDLCGNPSFEQLLIKVREITLAAYNNQDIPFEKLVEQLRPERSLNRHPVFDVMFNMINTPEVALELPGLTFEPLVLTQSQSKFLITIVVQQQADSLNISLVYRHNLFSAERMRIFLEQFEYLLQQIVTEPDRCIQSYSLVTPQSQSLLPNPSALVAEPEYKPVPSLFSAWAQQAPEQTAIRQNGQTWTYQELAQTTDAIAQVLLSCGVQPGDVVALCGPKSFGLIASMLGVFKSGAVLLMLDLKLPQPRQQLMLEEAQAKYLLNVVGTQSKRAHLTQSSLEIIDVDAVSARVMSTLQSSSGMTSCLPTLSANDLAYIFFTSGSTGTPKGVLGTHKGISHFLDWERQTFEIGPDERVAQLTSLTFDAVLRDVFLPLTSGATLCLPNQDDDFGIDEVLNWLETEQITVVHTVPALVKSWLTHANQGIYLRKLRWIFFSGEPLTQTLVHQWRQTFPEAGQMVNLYGATETTMVKCFYQVPKEIPAGVMPAGWALPDTQALVLNSTHQLCGIGEIGEIVIRTPFRTLGYINAVQEQQQRFVPNPLSNDPQDLLYYTGDKGRYYPDGALEVLGRLDDQIKIRGIRVAPGEISTVLNQHPAVAESVVVAVEQTSGDKCLVAYVVAKPNQTFAESELRYFLKKQLPQYLVPSIFVVLDALPLTANGKVNRRALPAPSVQVAKNATCVLPRTPTEEVIVNIFAEVLKLQHLGVDDNFFELGGHSLLATQVVSRLREIFQVEIPLRTLFEAPTVAELDQAILALRQTASGLVIPRIEPVSRATEFLPLSWAQERLWFLDQLEGSSATYNMPVAVQISGRLDVAALEQALSELVRRHEILRTTFPLVNGVPVQVIAPSSAIAIPVVDLRLLASVEQTAEVKRLGLSQTKRSFDLATDSLLRVLALQLGEDNYVLLVIMHHIISDDWSFSIFIQELSTLYQAFSSKVPSPLLDLPIQYADFAVWQRQWLKREILENQLNYWKQQLAGIPTLLDLPTDRQRPPVQTFRGSTETFELNADLTQQIKDLSQQSGTTLFMTLLAAFALLLSRYSCQEDIVLGSPIANRNRQEIESLIGIFINTLVLRIDLQNNPTFRELLQHVRQMTLDAYAHQDLPFEQLVEVLQPERSLGHHPLFQVMFVLHNAPQKTLELPGLTLTPLKQQRTVAKFDLTLSMSETASGLVGTWEYNSDLFEADTIQRMKGHFQTLLKSIVANSDRSVSQLSLLTEQEQYQMLVEWNNTQADYPVNKCVHHLFEEQAERTPENIAVVFENQHLTYAELNSQANQLAHYLQSQGVKPETLVGICIHPSLEMVVGLLGILKAGAAYVPLDPKYPQERLAFMLSNSGLPVLLTSGDTKVEVTKHQARLIDINKNWEIISQENEKNLIGSAQPEHLVYVIYTSGSTGKPKGVQISHQSVVNFLTAMQQQLGLTDQDVLLAVTTLSFDIAALELYLPLTVGAQVVLNPGEVASDGIQLAQKLAKAVGGKGATVMQATPVTWRLLLASGWKGHPHLSILVGGEALPQELATQLLSKGASVWNLYGPTETTIWSSVYKIKTQAKEACDTDVEYIGRPIANTQFYILDNHLQPTPIGVPGELHIGGAGLARGYLNANELNAEKFIPNPFSDKSETLLYKTGDLACYKSDGNVKFLGRIDNQVKIRGFRIELGEIEAVLTKHPAVREVVVIDREMSAGDKRLIAYIVPDWNQTPTSVELRDFLQKQLPNYMVPTNFVILKEMPLTPNGKINRRALPEPEQSLSQHDRFVPPRDRLELELTQIWSEVLNVNPVGVVNNFFDLGGHSLLAISLMARIQQKFGQILPLTTLFQGATVEQQAVLLRQQSDMHPWSALVTIQPKGSKPPLFFIHPGGGSVFNYLKLAQYLSTKRPLYGLEANGFESGQEPHSQVEEMATHYIKAIQTVQPNGPYLLAGWCLGGAIAFEMAQQLRVQGQRTSLLAMIDIFDFSANSDGFTPDEAALLVPLFRNHLSLPEEQLQQVEANLLEMEVDEQLAYTIDQAKQHNLQLPPGFGVEQLGRLLKVRKFHACAAVNYIPQLYYPGTITLLQASEGNSANSGNPTLGWEALVDKVELHWVPGNHRTIVQQPHVKVLAEKLQICLDQSQAEE
ncbi:amino acid adenylation domain-containing protein [Brasilonema sp. CT11]|nr:amino acid adenylation domain-containing protein [Brasilonema sp. CT11]